MWLDCRELLWNKIAFFLCASVSNVGHLCGIACGISDTEPVLFSLCFSCCCYCCYILIYLPLCNLDTEFSSSELTLSRIKSVLFLCFFVSTHKFSVVHDLRQMFLYQGRILKHFLKDFFLSSFENNNNSLARGQINNLLQHIYTRRDLKHQGLERVNYSQTGP